MNHHAPRTLPALSTLREGAGMPSAATMADYLGLSERAVWRYLVADTAPRPVMLSMFFASCYGASAINAQAVNEAAAFRSYVEALRTENARLTLKLGHVLALADTGASNGPSWRDLPLATVTPLSRAEAPRPTAA